MTVPPSVSLEHTLLQHGDVLYRVALLLGGDAARAASALQALARRAAGSEQSLDDAADSLRLLLPVLEQQDIQRRRRRPTRYPANAPLYGGPGVVAPFDSLPFAERRTLGLHLLLGYDLATVAAISGVSEDEARTSFTAAIEGLAAATSTALPDAFPSELCPSVRAAVMRAPEQIASDPTLRGHLALCSACRAFETAWSTLVRQTEAALRGALRPYALPPDLAATFVETQPAASLIERVMAGGRLSFALLPLGVLLLIGALVLPGFWRGDTSHQAATTPLAEPRAMVQQALAQVAHPPAGKGVWHAQWETLWFFPDGKYAPLYADAWLDSYNPARHRLQLVHGAGGALYELEVGDGDAALWYALSPTYYSSLYGTNAGKPNAPQLIHHAMDAAAQQRAATQRLEAGAWDVGPSYLRQAYSAPDLHTLGRQLDGTHAVQIVSFTGISPLGLPPDDPQVSLKNVTVLLALDSSDGRLRSVTELSGPPGGEQTSRVTWRLRSEEWLPNETSAREAFNADRAWNGQGTFTGVPQGVSADDKLLLYSISRRISFERMLSTPLPLPAVPPPDTDRAMLVSFNDNSPYDQWPPNASLTYLGQNRRMTLTWSESRGQRTTQSTSVSSDRGQHLLVNINSATGTMYPVMDIVIDASGYTRAEVQAVIESMRPLDLNGWRAQQSLFATIDLIEPQARAALVEALSGLTQPGPNEVIHRRERHSVRRDPGADTLSDPYHIPRDGGWPETMINEQWVQGLSTGGTFTTFSQVLDDTGQTYVKTYISDQNTWMYRPGNGSLERWSNSPINSPEVWMSAEAAAVLDMLSRPGRGVKLISAADGTRTVSRIEPIGEANRFNWLANVRSDTDEFANIIRDSPLPDLTNVLPSSIQTELELSPTGELRGLRYTALGASGANNDAKQVLLEAWTLEQEQQIKLDAAPVELRNGAPPTDVTFVDNQSPDQSVGMLRTATITEARTLARSPLFVLPEGGPFRLSEVINAGKGGVPVSRDTQNDDVLQESVIRGLSLHLSYAHSQNDDSSNGISLFQGPAAPLRAFLQSRPANWRRSEQRRVAIAGREVDVWLMQQDTSADLLIAEVDGTLLMLQGNNPSFTDALPLLASLQRTN